MKLKNSALVFILSSFVISSITVTQTARAGMHIMASYSDSQMSEQQEYRTSAGSMTISLDMGTYFNIGLTGKHQLSHAKGFEENEETKLIEYSESKVDVYSYSADLSIILYPGDIFVPYVFGGGVAKYFDSKKIYPSGSYIQRTTKKPILTYEGGIGVGLRLSEKFTFKYSVTFTPGVRLLSNGNPEPVLDRYQTVGLSYKI